MNYKLNNPAEQKKTPFVTAFKRFWPFLADEKKKLAIAFVAILLNSGLNLTAPYLVGHTVDKYIRTGNFGGVLYFSAILFGIFVVGFFASTIQTRTMGGVGQRVLFKLRNAIFNKLQSLPIAFFNQNKAGDLISRINNDTDKLNQFFSQALVQFMASIFVIIGAAIFLLTLNIRLGLAALAPAMGLLVITQLMTGWIKRKNAASLQSLGGMSGEIQESLNNFKVIVAFNRRDYFRERFEEANEANYKASVSAGIANNSFVPIYQFSQNLAQLIVVGYGIALILSGNLTVGLLVSFLLYVGRFYDPLRQLASLWTSLQLALAAWDRISGILSLESDLPTVPGHEASTSTSILEFRGVNFRYPDSKDILHNINFNLEKGKTYALVGPTGGGKTTTASLMARLYDPTEGSVLLDGKDIRSYSSDERAAKIGFILQEPFLFTGTVGDNIRYGNDAYATSSNEDLTKALEDAGLGNLIARFDAGLATPVTSGGDSISLGQKQLIAFIRAVLRRPELLILDEATANIDTVTEQLLEDILKKLPAETTRVIIAHRLNTIEHADEIFFVNSGEVTLAGSLDQAVEMLMRGKRES